MRESLQVSVKPVIEAPLDSADLSMELYKNGMSFDILLPSAHIGQQTKPNASGTIVFYRNLNRGRENPLTLAIEETVFIIRLEDSTNELDEVQFRTSIKAACSMALSSKSDLDKIIIYALDKLDDEHKGWVYNMFKIEK